MGRIPRVVSLAGKSKICAKAWDLRVSPGNHLGGERTLQIRSFPSMPNLPR